MKHKNIIWDWNGTIIDDAWLFVDIMNVFLSKEGLPLISLNDYRQHFCFPIQNYWRHLGFSFNESTFDKLNGDFIKLYKKNLFKAKPHFGIKPLILKLNKLGYRQFILSASSETILKKSINHYNFSSLFVRAYGVDNLNATGKTVVGKQLCKSHKLNKNETVLIGDTEYDKRVADELGCSVFLLSYGHFCSERLLTLNKPVFNTLEELFLSL